MTVGSVGSLGGNHAVGVNFLMAQNYDMVSIYVN